MKSTFASSVARLRSLALLPALSLSGCALTVIASSTDSAVPDAQTNDVNRDVTVSLVDAQRNVPIPDVATRLVDAQPDPVFIDVFIPIDSQCPPLSPERPLFIAQSPQGNRREANRLIEPCFAEIYPHLGERCAQPGFQCGIRNDGTGGEAITCTPGCPMTWVHLSGSAGPQPPPSLASEVG